LLLFAVVPSWLVSAVLSLSFRPGRHVAAHLAILALLGWIFTELSLIGFYKVPFTCSYLPGKSNIQLVFWAFFMVCLPLAVWISTVEHDALNQPIVFACLAVLFAAVACGLYFFNRYRARSAVLYFEELPEEVITTLGLST
jgi:apolipoprotein N-acyltransferase